MLYILVIWAWQWLGNPLYYPAVAVYHSKTLCHQMYLYELGQGNVAFESARPNYESSQR